MIAAPVPYEVARREISLSNVNDMTTVITTDCSGCESARVWFRADRQCEGRVYAYPPDAPELAALVATITADGTDDTISAEFDCPGVVQVVLRVSLSSSTPANVIAAVLGSERTVEPPTSPQRSYGQ